MGDVHVGLTGFAVSFVEVHVRVRVFSCSQILRTRTRLLGSDRATGSVRSVPTSAATSAGRCDSITSRTVSGSTPKYWCTRIFSEPADLRPSDLWMRVSDLRREMDDGLTDDLQVSLDGVFGHVNEVAILAGQRREVAVASVDRLEDVGDPLLGPASHSATASTSADSEIGCLSNCTGKMSMSSRPNSCRVSSMSPLALIRRFPSAGSISTRMSISLPSAASPRATDPKSRGFRAAYFARRASSSPRRASMTSRNARLDLVVTPIRSGYRPSPTREQSIRTTT